MTNTTKLAVHLCDSDFWTYLETGHSNAHSTDHQQVVRQELLQLGDAAALEKQNRSGVDNTVTNTPTYHF